MGFLPSADDARRPATCSIVRIFLFCVFGSFSTLGIRNSHSSRQRGSSWRRVSLLGASTSVQICGPMCLKLSCPRRRHRWLLCWYRTGQSASRDTQLELRFWSPLCGTKGVLTVARRLCGIIGARLVNMHHMIISSYTRIFKSVMHPEDSQRNHSVSGNETNINKQPKQASRTVDS